MRKYRGEEEILPCRLGVEKNKLHWGEMLKSDNSSTCQQLARILLVEFHKLIS